MNLKPMSLCCNTSRTAGHTIKTHLTRGTENSSPILHIVDTLNSKEITLSLIENSYIQATQENLQTHAKVIKRSSRNLKELLSNVDIAFQKPKFENLQQALTSYKNIALKMTRDLLIYSCICEACNKAKISCENLEDNMDILNEFVMMSLCYYNYHSCNVKFDFQALEEFIRTGFLHNTDIGENPEYYDIKVYPSKEVLIGIAVDSIYVLQTLDDVMYRIRYPEFFGSARDIIPVTDTVISLLWILLFRLNLQQSILDNVTLDEHDLKRLCFMRSPF